MAIHQEVFHKCFFNYFEMTGQLDWDSNAILFVSL